MYRYRVLTSFEIHPRLWLIANEAAKAASRALRIEPPKLFLIEEDQLLGKIEYNSRIVALAEPAQRSIYILADQPLAEIVASVFHETWHVADIQGGDRELRADAFVGRLWGSNANLSKFVEIMRSLEAIGTGTATDRSYSNRIIDAEQRKKVAEVRTRYYREGIPARAQLHIRPKNRGYFHAGIEFFNAPIKNLVIKRVEPEMITINEKDPVVQNYRGALAELQKLQNEVGRVSNDIDLKTQRLVSLRQRSQSERLADEAQAMLSSGVINESSGLVEEINQLIHRQEVLQTAIEMQREVVNRVKGPFSLMLNESQRARHKEIVSRIAKGVLEVARAFDDEILLFDELVQAEASPMFRPMRVNAVGSLSNQNSVATFFVRELREYFPEIKV